MKTVKMIPVFFIITLIMITPVRAQTPLNNRIDFIWDHDLEIGETSIHVRVYVPTTLTIEGLRNTVKPQEELTFNMQLSPLSGARIDFGQNSYPLDEVLKQVVKEPIELDLTIIEQLAPSILSNIIQSQLKLDKQTSDELAETLSAHTTLTISTSIEFQSLIEGPAIVEPRTTRGWFTEPIEEKVKVDLLAKDGDLINLTIKPLWKLTLDLDLAQEVYDNPSFGPLIKKLSSMIGLPMKKDLGTKTGNELIEYLMIVQTSSIFSPHIWVSIVIAAAAIIVVILLLIYRPKKPSWH